MNAAIETNTLTALKAKHPVNYDSSDFTQRQLSQLEAYANVDDVTLKRAPQDTLEGVANSIILAAERAEQEAIKANPPRYSRAYVERAVSYSIMSLYSDYKAEIEAEWTTWADYQQERKKWRRCKHKFCINVFPVDSDNFKRSPAKRNDSRFCCDSCRYAADEAKKRYKETGSYLPQSFYLPDLSESVGDRTRKQEYAATADEIEREANENRPQRYAPIKQEPAEINPIVSYNITDLTDEEINEKGLEKYAESWRVRRNSRGKCPSMDRQVGASAGNVPASF